MDNQLVRGRPRGANDRHVGSPGSHRDSGRTGTENRLNVTADEGLHRRSAPANVEKVCNALTVLADQASLEQADDVARYSVFRINDEITVDLMESACGISFEQAVPFIEWHEVDDVSMRRRVCCGA